MTGSSNSCCVCLNSFLCLNKLSQKDDNNMTLFTKLMTSIPEIAWAIKYQICEPCTNLLSIVYHFRETCLKSDMVRKQQETHEGSNDSIRKELDFDNKKDVTVESEVDKINHLKSDNVEPVDDSNDVNYTDNEEDIKSIFVEETKKSTKRKRRFEFVCEKCGKNFRSSKELVKHCVDEHGMNNKDVRPFVCTRCTSRFCNSSNLLQHMKYHEAVRSNVCSYCGKGFITKTDLKIHEKQHLNKREYSCESCLKSFNTHKDLRTHKLVVHTDPELWKYLCQYCQKKFPIKSNYDCHMRRHTGEKNFECHLCYKKFTDKCVLQRHMRTHSNVREFSCNVCDKEYKEKRVMLIHMAKVHGIGVGDIKLPSKERKYICHMCPKAYYARNKLTRHLYTHTGEKPFFCTICNKKFNDKSYVKQHMKKTHNIKSESPL